MPSNQTKPHTHAQQQNDKEGSDTHAATQFLYVLLSVPVIIIQTFYFYPFED